MGLETERIPIDKSARIHCATTLTGSRVHAQRKLPLRCVRVNSQLQSTLTLLEPPALGGVVRGNGFVGLGAISPRAVLVRLIATLAQPPDAALSALQALHDELLGVPSERLPGDFWTGSNLNRASIVELDNYMHVVRVDTAAPAAIWLRSMVEAQRGWLNLVGRGTANAVELQRVAVGFQTMHQLTARTLAAEIESAVAHPSVLQPRESAFESHELLEIWRTGHWIFFVFTQALTIAFKRLVLALRDGDDDSARIELTAATDLFWASGASMKLTGAFTNEQYHADVRPTMTLGADKALVKTTSLSGAMTSGSPPPREPSLA